METVAESLINLPKITPLPGSKTGFIAPVYLLLKSDEFLVFPLYIAVFLN